MKALTVATPTFNRAHTLPGVYESLCAQTDKNFIWLVIDDGSTDNTAQLVEGWKKENIIEIEYVAKENGGKASALNLGIGMLETPYAVCLDSDDSFYPGAVEKALSYLSEIEGDDSFCGILALRNNPDGTVMGKREIPAGTQRIKAEDIFLRWQLNTELICFYKTGILKNYRFPEFPGEKFVSPAWMQYKITEKYSYYPVWDKFCECEYVADGLTRNKRKVIKKNPRGYTAVKKFSFDYSRGIKQIVKNGIMYDYGCLLGKIKDFHKDIKHPVWAVLLMPAALIIKIIRKR